MQIDLVIGMSVVVVVAVIVGMGYAIHYAAKHIAEDEKKAGL